MAENIKLTDIAEAITQIELNQFIEEFNLSLPESYKEFIIQNNGGYPELSAYDNPYEDGFVVDMIYSVSLTDYDHNSPSKLIPSREIIKTHQLLEKNIPPYLYPFANHEGGAELCLSMDSSNFGAVYLVFLDYTVDQPIYVCESFDAFIDNLEDLEKFEE